ncbi:unnamed protein product [Caenorhabditis nigoni]
MATQLEAMHMELARMDQELADLEVQLVDAHNDFDEFVGDFIDRGLPIQEGDFPDFLEHVDRIITLKERQNALEDRKAALERRIQQNEDNLENHH